MNLEESLGSEPVIPNPTRSVRVKRNPDYSALLPEYARTLEDNGLYPSVEDSQFVSRLLQKSEFADTVSTYDPNENPCGTDEDGNPIQGKQVPDFEITPVQRFVANFLHPRTPYMSALLYHGVGVGKTCAAIQTAEAFLDVYPKRKVIIVCPRAIRAGFYRTIFDITTLKIGSGPEPNSVRGCTGDTYLRLSNSIDEKNKEDIEKRVKRVINSRYIFFGYLEFRNYIRSIIKTETDPEKRAIRLQREFNYRLLIIDEAHNLRDVLSMTGQEEDEDLDTAAEKDESQGGKELTPFLKELLKSTEGMKLLLMTATPMFNTVFEIHFLLNLLLMNDKKPEIPMESILDEYGNIVEGAEKVLRPIANTYISFMRGENPNSFPLRLFPSGVDPNGEPVNRLTPGTYPQIQLEKTLSKVVPEQTRIDVSKLPIVVSFGNSIYDSNLHNLTKEKVKGGIGYQVVDSLLQAANCIFPQSEDSDLYSSIGKDGFDATFKKVEKSKGAVKATDAKWLLLENIRNYAPKVATIMRYLKHTDGIGFVYSRFVKTGAMLLALALEANGYTPYGREPLLANGIQDDLGKQCALCSMRQRQHKGMDHDFVAAKYGLLTGDILLSPNNADVINVARSAENKNGEKIKVVLGSQITGEGIDLRFIREIHILDAWFHLNKTEQIIGRGIRYCSHSLLPLIKRNTTVFLHVAGFANRSTFETADIYCYRVALSKAQLVGNMSRLLKVYAVDCNLRKKVTILKGLSQRKQIDSQGQPRNAADGTVNESGNGIQLDDMDFTAICDWMECKPITCSPDQIVNPGMSNDSTYSAFSARFRETSIQNVIRAIFAESPYQRQEDLIQVLLMQGIPRAAIDMTLQGIVNNRLFKVKSGSQEGYITYKNKYFLFQPIAYRDLKIPIALRIAAFPIKKDEYSPEKMDIPIEAPLITAKAENEIMTEKIEASEFWNSLIKWLDLIATSDKKEIGVDIERKIELYTSGSKAKTRVFIDKLKALINISKCVTNVEIFKKVALQYFWDEWIDVDIQIKLLLAGIKEPDNEQLVQSGNIKAIRTINPKNGALEFICDDGNPCSRIITDAFKKMTDPIKSSSADINKTGKLYGFIVPKKGKMVFKTQSPHPIGKIPDIGEECAIITSKSHFSNRYTILSNVLSESSSIQTYINKNKLDASVTVLENATQRCIYLDFILRYFDQIELHGKRWFFRPIAAYYSKHVSEKVDKLATRVVKKDINKREQEISKSTKPVKRLVIKREEEVPKPVEEAPVIAKTSKPLKIKRLEEVEKAVQEVPKPVEEAVQEVPIVSKTTKPLKIKRLEEVEEVVQEVPKPVEEVVQEAPKPVEEVVQEVPKPVEEAVQEVPKPVEEVVQEVAKPVEEVPTRVEEAVQEVPKPVEEDKAPINAKVPEVIPAQVPVAPKKKPIFLGKKKPVVTLATNGPVI
jgi:hypothetical protein